MAEPSEIQAFSAEQVCRLTGLSRAQLRYWDDTAFFSPRYADTEAGRPFGRIYSFRDVVGLRMIALLRNERGVPLQQLRRVGSYLKKHRETPWASVRFYLAGRQVAFEHPKTGSIETMRPPGQTMVAVTLEPIAREVSERVAQFRRRTSEHVGRIVRNRYVMHNAPVIAGTRIPVSAIRNFHAAGYDVASIIREYPTLTRADIEAALYAGAHPQRRRAG